MTSSPTVGSLGDGTPAASIFGLAKSFGDLHAVTQVDMTVPRGSFYGIAGPNGAGKTTTIRMLCGLLAPDTGSITVAGTEVWPDPSAAQQLLGYVPDNPALFDRLTAVEMLEYAGHLRGLDAQTIATRSADLLAVLDLEGASDRMIADYSLGMTKRIGLAVAMLHAPRLLVLDEPFGALDPVNTNVMEQMLQLYREGGGTVLFSSHVMDVVERLCDRVIVIAQGRVLTEGTVAEVSGEGSLQEAFVALVGGRDIDQEDLGWLASSSD